MDYFLTPGLTFGLCSTDVCRMAGWDDAADMGMVVSVCLPCETGGKEWRRRSETAPVTNRSHMQAEAELTISMAENGL